MAFTTWQNTWLLVIYFLDFALPPCSFSAMWDLIKVSAVKVILIFNSSCSLERHLNVLLLFFFCHHGCFLCVSVCTCVCVFVRLSWPVCLYCCLLFLSDVSTLSIVQVKVLFSSLLLFWLPLWRLPFPLNQFFLAIGSKYVTCYSIMFNDHLFTYHVITFSLIYYMYWSACGLV